MVADDHASVIPIESDADVVTARQQARAMASRLELSSTDQTLLATAISEVARNITTYAKRGEVLLSVIQDDGGRRGIQVVARDEGPGIENVELALQDGYTSGEGLGLGLPGARRLVDHFEIETTPGAGTRVTLVMWERGNSRVA
jgi:serine/threonine-protein kinase RsbT